MGKAKLSNLKHRLTVRQLNRLPPLMNVQEISDYYLKTINTSWDYQKDPSHGLETISFEKVNNFINDVNSNSNLSIIDDPLTVLKKFELLRDGAVTFGCFLLFAAVFKECGLIEKYGSGIKRILEACNAHGSPNPVFEQFQHGFRVTVYKTTQKATQKTAQKTTRKIKTRDQIIQLLKENPRLTRDALATALNKSPNTVKEHIAKLKAEGKLQRVGSDREGYWKTIES